MEGDIGRNGRESKFRMEGEGLWKFWWDGIKRNKAKLQQITQTNVIKYTHNIKDVKEMGRMKHNLNSIFKNSGMK